MFVKLEARMAEKNRALIEIRKKQEQKEIEKIKKEKELDEKKKDYLKLKKKRKNKKGKEKRKRGLITPKPWEDMDDIMEVKLEKVIKQDDHDHDHDNDDDNHSKDNHFTQQQPQHFPHLMENILDPPKNNLTIRCTDTTQILNTVNSPIFARENMDMNFPSPPCMIVPSIPQMNKETKISHIPLFDKRPTIPSCKKRNTLGAWQTDCLIRLFPHQKASAMCIIGYFIQHYDQADKKEGILLSEARGVGKTITILWTSLQLQSLFYEWFDKKSSEDKFLLDEKQKKMNLTLDLDPNELDYFIATATPFGFPFSLSRELPPLPILFRTLILVPSNLIETVWEYNIRKMFGSKWMKKHVRFYKSVIIPPQEEEKEEKEKKTEDVFLGDENIYWIIITFESLLLKQQSQSPSTQRDYKKLYQFRWDLVIVDEIGLEKIKSILTKLKWCRLIGLSSSSSDLIPNYITWGCIIQHDFLKLSLWSRRCQIIEKVVSRSSLHARMLEFFSKKIETMNLTELESIQKIFVKFKEEWKKEGLNSLSQIKQIAILETSALKYLENENKILNQYWENISNDINTLFSEKEQKETCPLFQPLIHLIQNIRLETEDRIVIFSSSSSMLRAFSQFMYEQCLSVEFAHLNWDSTKYSSLLMIGEEEILNQDKKELVWHFMEQETRLAWFLWQMVSSIEPWNHVDEIKNIYFCRMKPFKIIELYLLDDEPNLKPQQMQSFTNWIIEALSSVLNSTFILFENWIWDKKQLKWIKVPNLFPRHCVYSLESIFYVLNVLKGAINHLLCEKSKIIYDNFCKQIKLLSLVTLPSLLIYTLGSFLSITDTDIQDALSQLTQFDYLFTIPTNKNYMFGIYLYGKFDLKSTLCDSIPKCTIPPILPPSLKNQNVEEFIKEINTIHEPFPKINTLFNKFQMSSIQESVCCVYEPITSCTNYDFTASNYCIVLNGPYQKMDHDPRIFHFLKLGNIHTRLFIYNFRFDDSGWENPIPYKFFDPGLNRIFKIIKPKINKIKKNQIKTPRSSLKRITRSQKRKEVAAATAAASSEKVPNPSTVIEIDI